MPQEYPHDANLDARVRKMLERCEKEKPSIELLEEVNALKEGEVRNQNYDVVVILRDAERSIQKKLRENKDSSQS